jgi:hypothetical protein
MSKKHRKRKFKKTISLSEVFAERFKDPDFVARVQESVVKNNQLLARLKVMK